MPELSAPAASAAPVAAPASAAPSATPTPSPSTPSAPPPSAPEGIEASIDALLNAPTPTEEDNGAGPAKVPETPTPEQPKPEEPAQATEEPEDPETDEDLDSAMADAAKPNMLDLKHPRGKRIYGAYKQYKAITDALGRELSVDEARAFQEAYSDKLAMEHEFTSGDPLAARNWVENWHKTNPQAMQVVGHQMADYLATADPAAYTPMALSVINRFINAQYQMAQQATDPNERKSIQYMAQMADWVINNKFRDEATLASQPAPDPLAAREAQVNAGLSQIQSFQQQQYQASVANWNQGLDAANNSALDQAADAVLDPIKSTFPARLAVAAKRDFIQAVKDHLAKDKESDRIYGIQRSKSQQRMSSEDQQALASNYAQRAARAVRAVAPGFLKELGVVAKSQSQARHAALSAAADAGKAPTSSGQPTTQSIIPTQGQYASKVEVMESSIDSLLGVKR